MKFTEYLKLKKPESEIDYVLIEDFNENSDSVDKKIKEVDQKVEENSSAIGQMDEKKLDKSGGIMTGTLKLPSIDMNSTKIKTFSKKISIPGQSEIEIDLGSSLILGTLDISVIAYWNSANASGSITKRIDFSGGTTIEWQRSSYIQVSSVIEVCYMISDIYIKNGKKYIKIIRNPHNAGVDINILIKSIGIMDGFETINIGEPVASIETFISPSMKPVENIITSGFASGWTGEIRYDKYREGNMHIQVTLTKSSDYGGGGTLLYTFPVGNRPAGVEVQHILLLTNDGVIVAGSEAVCYIDSAGRLWIVSRNGTSLTNARKVQCSFEYTARN